MINEFIAGEKIYLRALEPADAALIAKSKNAPHVRETFFWAFPENIEQNKDDFKDLYKPSNRTSYIPFAITIKESDKAIGITAFHRYDSVSRSAVFSIIVADKNESGKGYAGEATKLMLKYGFDILNLNRIQLIVCAENEKAAHIYEKAGFVREGVLRQAMYHYNRYADFIMMSILREEYYK